MKSLSSTTKNKRFTPLPTLRNGVLFELRKRPGRGCLTLCRTGAPSTYWWSAARPDDRRNRSERAAVDRNRGDAVGQRLKAKAPKINPDATEINAAEIEDAIRSRAALRIFCGRAGRSDLRYAHQLLAWLHARNERLVSPACISSVQIRCGKAPRVVPAKIVDEHGHLVRVRGGAVVDGKFRRDVWRVVICRDQNCPTELLRMQGVAALAI